MCRVAEGAISAILAERFFQSEVKTRIYSASKNDVADGTGRSSNKLGHSISVRVLTEWNVK